MEESELFLVIWKKISSYKAIILALGGLVFFIFTASKLLKIRSLNIFFSKNIKIFIIKRDSNN